MESTSNSQIYAPDFLNDVQRLHATLQSAGIGIWEVRLDTNMVSWDDQCKRLFGLDADNNISYEEAIKHIHPDDREAVNTAVKNALDGVNNGKYEMLYRTIGAEDKKLRWVRFSGQAFFDNEKKPVRFAGVARDETDVVDSEIARKSAEERTNNFIEIANSLPQLVWMTDAKGRQSFASRRWEEFTGVKPADADTFREIVHPDDFASITQAWAESLETGRQYRGEVRLKRNPDGYEWFSFVGEPLRGPDGQTEKWIGTFTNVHDQKTTERELFEAFKELEDNESTFNDVTNSSPTGLWLSNETGELTYLNKTLVEWTGLPYESLLGTGWANAIIEEDRAHSAATFLRAVASRTHYDVNFRIRKKDGNIVWCRAAGDPFYRDGVYKGYAGFCMDIDEMVNITNEFQAGEERFRNMVEQAPMAIGLLKGRDMIVEIGNDKFYEVLARDKSIAGRKIIEAVPEIVNQGFIEIMESVFDTGKPFFGNGVLAKLQRRGRLDEAYFDFVYTPLRDSRKAVVGIMVLGTEVTNQVIARQAIEASERKMRSLIHLAPAAICLFVGKDHVVEMPNQAFIELVGKGPGIINNPLADVLPELEDQALLKQVEESYAQGKVVRADAAQVNVSNDGVISTRYYNSTYSPLFDASGQVYGVLDIAIDVTDAVNASKKIREAEGLLRAAVELAELATWSAFRDGSKFECSERFSDWLGTKRTKFFNAEFYDFFEGSSRSGFSERIRSLFYEPEVNSFQEEFQIVNQHTGQIRIVLLQGQVVFEPDQPISVKGTCQDITRQKALQRELERLVQMRTEELAATNEQLQSANEELSATNEELSESTNQLSRSNQELLQYAYVASHDLQEPLRKILTFSDRLLTNSQLSPETGRWVNKIHQSSERMSQLIKNLLEFSKLVKPEETFEPVDLNRVILDLGRDFELMIEEKNAILETGNLPELMASPLQMQQLFHNLLSNALKFSSPHRRPVISIQCKKITRTELSQFITTPRTFSKYYHITVTDNGIGFEKQYAELIFEIFRRLHGKDEYKGTGIGLALCKRIVSNHGGHIHADSVRDEGSTFHIFLPRHNGRAANYS